MRSAARLLRPDGGRRSFAGTCLAVQPGIAAGLAFQGPLNFSVGANYLRYSTVEDYYVFFNLVSAIEQLANGQGPWRFHHMLSQFRHAVSDQSGSGNIGSSVRLSRAIYPSNFGCGFGGNGRVGTYIDPNPITSLDGQGHNYFRSENPYNLNSMAGFGEVYYQLTPDVKLTGGLRWTDDKKTFENIPSWVFLIGGGYPVLSIVHQEWKEATGRFNVDWSPKLDFTDQTLVYASYARGYKGGGANPPGPMPNAVQRPVLPHASGDVQAGIRQCV